jgi:hypothetical protein
MEDQPEDLPSSPIFGSLATAFGLALGELVLLLGDEDDLEYALRHAWIAAEAVILSGK